jgi:hypothetical protein
MSTMESPGSSTSLIRIYETTWRQIPEDRNLISQPDSLPSVVDISFDNISNEALYNLDACINIIR